MGCGKSTVAALLGAAGFRVLDSDLVVRDVLLAEAEVKAALRERWGERVFGPGGGVDRRAVAARVFGDDPAREWLEGVLHPRLFAHWRGCFHADPEGPWVVEVPLLFEKQLENWFDFILCVGTTSPLQLARLEERGIPQALAVQRISKQLPLAQKLELADFVLSNDGSVEFLREQVERLVSRLRAASA